MSWFRVDDKSAFHRKVLKAGNEAWGALCRAGAQSAGEGTDGRVTLDSLLAIAPMRVWKKAIKAELLEPIEGSTDYQIHDYLQWNESAEEIEAKAAARRKKSADAAQARWGARGRIRASSDEASGSTTTMLQASPEHAPSITQALLRADAPRCPDPIRSDPIRDLSLKAVAEDLLGDPAREPARSPQQQRQGLSAQWLLDELRRHPGLSAVANEHFAASLVGVLVSKPKPPDVVSQAIADAALHSAGLGLNAETLQRKVSGYVLHARRREAPKPETRCPASSDPDAADWLHQEDLPALSSAKGADVALMLDHYAERAMTSANWKATWSKWRASERPHPVGPAPGHRKREPREQVPELGPMPSLEENQALARAALAKLGGAL